MVLGKPSTKCPHGIYRAGEPTARYCGFCNPNTAFKTVASAVTVSLTEHEEKEEVLDCFQYMHQRAGSRLAKGTHAIQQE